MTYKAPSLPARILVIITLALSFSLWIPTASAYVTHTNIIPEAQAAIDSSPDIPEGSGFVPPPKKYIPKELAEDDLRTRVMRIVNYALSFLGLAAVVVIVYGGILMVVSAGDEEQSKKGKTAIFYAIIGIIIILLSYAIVNWALGAATYEAEPTATTAPTGVSTAGDSEDVQNELRSLQNEIDALQRTNNRPEQIIQTKEVIREFFDRLPDDSENQRKMNYLLDLLNKLQQEIGSKAGTDNEEELERDTEDVIDDLTDELEQLDEAIAEMPVMTGKIIASPVKGPAPLTVVLDGTASIDPTNATIPDSNYHWSYRDNMGAIKTLPSEPVITETFNEVGKYVIKLRVETATLVNGVKAAIDGVGYINIFVEPPAAEILLKINGEEAHDLYKIILDEAKEGLNFDARESVSRLGREFTLFKWDFGDNVKEELSTSEPLTHSYVDAKDYKMKLDITDDQGDVTKKNVIIRIKALLGNIKIAPEQGNTLTNFSFDSRDSKISEGLITQYSWIITRQGEEIIRSDKDRFEYRFDQPGTYETKLTVFDSLGREDVVIKDLVVSSQAPIANFSWDKQSESTPSTLLFDATLTFDPDENDEIFFDWDFDGDGTFDVLDSKERIIPFKYKKIGEYETTLLVRDSHGSESIAKRSVQITSLLDADFVADRYAAQAGTQINFRADSEGAESFFWDFNDGVTQQSDTETLSHSFKEASIYKVTLTVYDEEDNETSVTKNIHIGEKEKPLAIMKILINGKEIKVQPDVCGFGRDGIVVSRNDIVFFDAGLSLSTDGTNRGLTYAWDFGDAEYATARKVNHRYSELTAIEECNEVILVVKDRATGSAHRSKLLYVRVINKLPVFSRLSVKPPPGALETPVNVKLEILGAHDYDGRLTQYRFWYYYEDAGDKKYGIQVSNRPWSTISILPRGYEEEKHNVFFAAEAIDNDGGRNRNLDLGMESIPLEIKNGPNAPPAVILKSNKTSIKTGDDVILYAEAIDPQGGIIPKKAYQWDFDGDGNIDDRTSGHQVSHTYKIPGEYEIRVKVTYQGLSTTEKHTIFVDPLSEYPVAAFKHEVKGLTVSFDASRSQWDPNVEGNSLTYSWDFNLKKDSDGDGDPSNDVDATSVKPAHSYPEEEAYQVKLIVRDQLKMEDSVVHTIRIGGIEGIGVEKAESIHIRSVNQPLTTLDVEIENAEIKTNETTRISAQILNADGSSYEGEVRFLLTEGTGNFIPDIVKAVNSEAETIFNPSEPGIIKFKIIAKDAVFGDIEEEMIIKVK